MNPITCAWCRAILDQGDPDLPVSHGICDDCAKIILPAIQTAPRDPVNAKDLADRFIFWILCAFALAALALILVG